MTLFCCPSWPRFLVPTRSVGTQAGPPRRTAFPGRPGDGHSDGLGRPSYFKKSFLAGIFLLVLALPCPAQNRSNPGGTQVDQQVYGRRTDAFRRLLFEMQFQPIPSFTELLESGNPSEKLFILLGEPSCLTRSEYSRYFPNGGVLRDFVKQGGAVLIATDKETKGRAAELLTKLAGVTVTGQMLVLQQPSEGDESFPCYDNSVYCPLVQPIEGSVAARSSSNILRTLAALLGTGSRPDLFRRGLQPDQRRLIVATNAPSCLTIPSGELPLGIHRLARLPRSCQDESARAAFGPDGEVPFVDENGPLFAVGGTIDKGRVLVLADHSIFINRMMLPRSIDNLEFAANCLHWLRGGVSTKLEMLKAAKNADARSPAERANEIWGKRTHVLFWDGDQGRVQTDFHVPLRKVPLPPTLASEPAIVAAIDKTIARLEDEDYFNEGLYASMDDLPGGRWRVYRYAVYLTTLAAAMLLAYRFLWRTRHRTEATIPLLADAIGKHEPKATLLDQRRRELWRLGNLWEMGHRLAREFFESAGVPLTGTSPPRVEIAQGGWRQRFRWRRSIDRLWRLARRDAPAPLSPAALQYRLRELEELKTALADGTIVLKAKINHGFHGSHE